MKKEDLLQPEIENVLLDIDFVEKYKIIWEKYIQEDENYKVSDIDVYRTFEQLGYIVKKQNEDQFFSDFFLDNEFYYRIGIAIMYNILHFEISVSNEKFKIMTGGGYGLLVQLITNWEMPIKTPKFYNLNSFKSLVRDLCELFEEIKTAINCNFGNNNLIINYDEFKENNFFFFDGIKIFECYKTYDNWLSSVDYNIYSKSYVQSDGVKILLFENRKELLVGENYSNEKLISIADKYDLIYNNSEKCYCVAKNHLYDRFFIVQYKSYTIIYGLGGTKSIESIYIHGVWKC